MINKYEIWFNEIIRLYDYTIIRLLYENDSGSEMVETENRLGGKSTHNLHVIYTNLWYTDLRVIYT